MWTSQSAFDLLLDDLRRFDPLWESVFGASPSSSGIRSVPSGAFPQVNVISSSDSVSVYVFAAGLDPKKLDVSLQQNLLTLSGEREERRAEQATYYRRERFNGAFRRVLTLPEDVDPAQVDASYRDGVLQVRIGRRESAKPRRIDVH